MKNTLFTSPFSSLIQPKQDSYISDSSDLIHRQRRNLLKLGLGGATAAAAGITGQLFGNNLLNNLIPSAQAQNNNTPVSAPELRVPYWIDGDGKETKAFTLADHEGKWVFLKCFQNWCPGCHSHGFPTLQKLVETFGTEHEKIAFAGIQTTFEGHYTNNKEALRPLQLRYKSPIPFGQDAGDPNLERSNPKHFPSTMLDYRTRGTPWLILITPDRQVAYSNHHVKTDGLIEYLQSVFAA